MRLLLESIDNMTHNLLNYYVAIDKETGKVYLSDSHDRFNPINISVTIVGLCQSLTNYIILPYYKFINTYSLPNCSFVQFSFGNDSSSNFYRDVWILKINSKDYQIKKII